MDVRFDAVVIGGGFYGCNLARFLSKRCQRVVIVEKESELLTRASYVNQARIHSGYHYPRSFLTALRSFFNFPRFVKDFHDCVDSNFKKLYAIARESKVSARQFSHLYSRIGAPIRTAPKECWAFFNSNLIEEIFEVTEFAFNAVQLRCTLKERLRRAGVNVFCETEVRKVVPEGDVLLVHLENGDQPLRARHVFNCAYSQINTVLQNSGLPLLSLKHELCEMPLLEVPEELKDYGITIMDGPFFAVMPFPAKPGLHSLHHVVWSPHHFWQDTEAFRDPDLHLKDSNLRSRYPYMIRDAQRYIPLLAKAQYVKSLFEIKTVLMKNEIDDGRPILYRKDYGLKNFSLVLGGKIDNIYDVISILESLEAKGEGRDE